MTSRVPKSFAIIYDLYQFLSGVFYNQLNFSGSGIYGILQQLFDG